MNENTIAVFLEQAMQCNSIKELQELQTLTIADKLQNNRLAAAAASIAHSLVILKEKQTMNDKSLLLELSETEREEKLMVQKLLDHNMLTYHFQPIVRADNGAIFSYEALMRAEGMQGITPFHILKYAEMSHRLGEVEEYTFINVLNYISQHSELFGDCKIFINSLPNVYIDPNKQKQILNMLDKYADRVVIEMIENSEFEDERLASIKKYLHEMGIPIAIDDFGTGYSNISNMLRYQPDYIKIDRSLISGIQNNPSKRQIVSEVIAFCHSNKIKILAEGVETSEELRTVILMGFDLIQGYYTAKPSPDIIRSIPHDIKTEIINYYQEREDGHKARVYYMSHGETVFLKNLQNLGYDKIVIGYDWAEGAATVFGSPQLYTDIHIDIAPGFKGTVTLEWAHLSNQLERPCIDIGENCDVSLNLIGNNKLSQSGIRVPNSSRLVMQGKGDLEIQLGAADFYGIGNDLQSKHGDLIFDQDGTISISSGSHTGVCIGSGLGGFIGIHRGRYVIRAMGALSVGLGAVDGPSEIDIVGCDMDLIAAGAFSVGIGTSDADAMIHIMYSSLKCRVEGQLAVGIGSLHGNNAVISIENISASISGNADALTALGSLRRNSDITIASSGVQINCNGSNVLAFGSVNGGTKIQMHNADCKVKQSSELTVCAIMKPEDLHIEGGQIHVQMGDHSSEQIII